MFHLLINSKGNVILLITASTYWRASPIRPRICHGCLRCQLRSTTYLWVSLWKTTIRVTKISSFSLHICSFLCSDLFDSSWVRVQHDSQLGVHRTHSSCNRIFTVPCKHVRVTCTFSCFVTLKLQTPAYLIGALKGESYVKYIWKGLRHVIMLALFPYKNNNTKHNWSVALILSCTFEWSLNLPWQPFGGA